MRKIFLMAACLAAFTVLASCEKPSTEKPGPDGPVVPGDTTDVVIDAPVLSLVSDDRIEVGYEGGTFTIEYTVTNPAEDGSLSAYATEGADWCSGFDCSEEGIVAFSVAGNEGEARECEVTLVYDYADGTQEVSVTVVQAEASPYDYVVDIESVSGDYWGGQHTISINTEMEYELHMSDASGEFNYIFHLYSTRPSDLEAPAPPAGTYRLDTENLTNQWTISRSLSGFYTTDEASAIRFEEAQIEITGEGDGYSYLMHLTDAEGMEHEVTYNGPVALVNQDQTFISTLEDDVELNIANGEAAITGFCFGSSRYPGVNEWALSLYYAESSKNSWCYQIHLLLPADNTFEDGVTPGIYPVSTSREAGTVVAGYMDEDDWIMGGWAYDLYYNEDLPRGPMVEGEVIIELDESTGVYTFTFDCVDDNRETPHKITGTISGIPSVSDFS